MTWMRRVGGWRASGIVLVALALVLRLAAPAGWMLASGDGGPKLVICTGHGPSEMPMPSSATQPGGHQAPAPDKHADHPCIFAGAHAAPTPVLIAAVLAPTAIAFTPETPTRLADQRPGRGLAAPPPPAHAPPTLA